MPLKKLAALEDSLSTVTPDGLAAVVREGLVVAWPPTEVVPAFDPDLMASFDHALTLIGQVLPDWTIALSGTRAANDGTWSCTLRESGLRDDYEVIGIGHAATVPVAMMLALLQVLISRAKGST